MRFTIYTACHAPARLFRFHPIAREGDPRQPAAAITTSTSSVSNLTTESFRASARKVWHGWGTAVTGHRLSKSHGRDMARARQAMCKPTLTLLAMSPMYRSERGRFRLLMGSMIVT
ncbi:hypothetical protein J6590_045081 [Homalodisca vitripennis]|nr:hypothetical protein J6590_045081 [Homalodisca vitripennis]